MPHVYVVSSSVKLDDVAPRSSKLDNVSADVATRVWFGQ